MMPLNNSERAPLALALSRMLAGFNDHRPSNVEMTVATYITALSSLPFWAIERTIFDIERGHVEGLSPDFRPTIARIYQLTEAKLEEIRNENTRIEIILDARVDDVPSYDPEEGLRVEAKMKAFARELTKMSEAAREKNDQKQKENTQRALERRYDEFLAEYRVHGYKPIYSFGGPMSLSMARTIGAKLQPLDEPIEVQTEPE